MSIVPSSYTVNPCVSASSNDLPGDEPTGTDRPLVISPKKLIEVALPLDAINVASAREKSIRHGHPSTLHLWWARRPLAAARAVIFSQLVHDPEDLWRCQNPGVEPNKQVRGHWTRERGRLFEIIEDLVKWENTTNEAVLNRAREEIRKAWRETCELNRNHAQAAELFHPDKMPGLHDPFAGGGSIPLEAQRLGLEAYASDLNPVAVLINKAMIEIPPKFANRPPVNPEARNNPLKTWTGAQGLADDVRYYGKWMRDEAFKRIGHLYPKVAITPEIVRERPDLEAYEGQKLTVIAWLWARTVKSPNPAFSHVDVPLASTFILSSKEGKASYVEPVVSKSEYKFTVKAGRIPTEAKIGTKAARGNFRCLMSQTPIDTNYLRLEANAGRMGQKLMAIVAEGTRGRVYLTPTSEHEGIANSAIPSWKPDVDFFQQALGFRVGAYGMTKWSDLFTQRQLVTLTTFCDLIGEVRDRLQQEASVAGLSEEDLGLESGGVGARSYAEAVSIYLGFNISKMSDLNNSLVTWKLDRGCPVHLFARQAIPMVWDYPEANPFSESSGSWQSVFWHLMTSTDSVCMPCVGDKHFATQGAAQTSVASHNRFVSTDPPYYDNIGYADLSDFFYVWLRRSLHAVFPKLLSTISVPKADELVATPARHGGKQNAEQFFLHGMTETMHNLAIQAHPAAPISIYYAFKQSETEKEGTNSTGWETFLEAVNQAGLALTGTWPMRTELTNRMRGMDSNALASSIILVCRPRLKNAGTISRRQFVRMLHEDLPKALDLMTRASEDKASPVAPVDLSQAIIGPGMAIFSRYEAVLEADGTPMGVKTALQLINRFLAEDDFDADTQFCLHWFEQHGWEAGKFGEADTLARAKGTSVEGVRASGVVEAGGGIVRLLRWREYPADWDPATDPRLPVWEALHQLIRAYNSDGDSGAARVLSAISSRAESSRQLAYRLYTLCERSGLAEDARAYNEVVTGWTGIESAATTLPPPPEQGMLF